jgi:hypothetical protein
LWHIRIEPGQYVSIRYTERLAEAGIAASVGTVGDSFDNALAETINGLYKTELIKPRGPWRTLDAVEIATAEWVDWSRPAATAQLPRLRRTRRVRAGLLPSDQPPTAPAGGRTRCGTEPGAVHSADGSSTRPVGASSDSLRPPAATAKSPSKPETALSPPPTPYPTTTPTRSERSTPKSLRTKLAQLRSPRPRQERGSNAISPPRESPGLARLLGCCCCDGIHAHVAGWAMGGPRTTTSASCSSAALRIRAVQSPAPDSEPGQPGRSNPERRARA